MLKVPFLSNALILAVASLGLSAPAFSNDSSIDAHPGNVTFIKNTHIAMKEETLEIFDHGCSIRVDYEFENLTDKEETLEIGFPLPKRPMFADNPGDVKHFYIFADGEPVPAAWKENAYLGGELLPAEWLSLLHEAPCEAGCDEPEQWSDFLTDPHHGMDSTQDNNKNGKIDKLKKLKALYEEHFKRKDWVQLAKAEIEKVWVWKHSFAPKKRVHITHLMAGTCGFGGMTDLEQATCMNDLPTFKRQKTGPPLDVSFVRYVLKTGANWAGPIEKFKLIIKKDEDQVVSICFRGLKKVSSTRFEAERSSFTPQEDLAVAYLSGFWANKILNKPNPKPTEESWRKFEKEPISRCEKDHLYEACWLMAKRNGLKREWLVEKAKVFCSDEWKVADACDYLNHERGREMLGPLDKIKYGRRASKYPARSEKDLCKGLLADECYELINFTASEAEFEWSKRLEARIPKLRLEGYESGCEKGRGEACLDAAKAFRDRGDVSGERKYLQRALLVFK